MPRINTVKSAKKAQGTCVRCGKPIEVGHSYRWLKFRYGDKRSIHVACGSFRPSEMTSNDKLSQLYSIQEQNDVSPFDMGDDDPMTEALADELRGWQDDIASQIREVAWLYEESASNIEDGFGHETEQSAELREHGEMVDGWADEIELIDPETHETYGEWWDEVSAVIQEGPGL